MYVLVTRLNTHPHGVYIILLKEILCRGIARYLKGSGLSHYIWGRVTIQV
jgi:hypothetical protein